MAIEGAPGRGHWWRSGPGRWVLTGLLVLTLGWQWGSALGIQFKAHLAQVLIERAWEQALRQPAGRAAPWPWADMEPVGRLQWRDERSRMQKDLFILAGAHGSALAFGPGLMDGLGEGGARVVGGHRDTHFAFLNRLEPGDRLRWQGRDGRWQAYRVGAINIADSREGDLWLDPQADVIWLVTCYPFDGVRAGGPLRYVVRADRVSESLVRDNRVDTGSRVSMRW